MSDPPVTKALRARFGLDSASSASPQKPHIVTPAFNPSSTAAPRAKQPTPFTEADRQIIRHLHSVLSLSDLLQTLNERLLLDRGEDAIAHTMPQLMQEIEKIKGGADEGASGWPAIRKLLARARRDGVLQQINEQLIDDFAVVFLPSSKQVAQLKDTLLDTEDN